jgi:MFS family permease
MRGRYNAFFQLSFGVASTVGPALFTLLLSVSHSLAWYLMGVLCLLTALAFTWVERAEKRR